MTTLTPTYLPNQLTPEQLRNRYLFLYARSYDPSIGRFSTLDPFGGNENDPQSLHKYMYANGNPVMGIDPSGLVAMNLPTLMVSASITNYMYAMSLTRSVSLWKEGLRLQAKLPFGSASPLQLTPSNVFGDAYASAFLATAIPVLSKPAQILDSFAGSIFMQLSVIPRAYWYAATDWNKLADLYPHSTLGQANESGPTISLLTKIALGISALAATSAGGLIVLEAAGMPTMEITVVEMAGQRHVAYRVTQKGLSEGWRHGVGRGHPVVVQAGDDAFLGLSGAGGWWNTIAGIPVASSSAVNSTGILAYNCVTAALRALARGWGLPF